MCNLQLQSNFKVGIIKELQKRGLISENQMKRAIEILKNQNYKKIIKGEIEK